MERDLLWLALVVVVVTTSTTSSIFGLVLSAIAASSTTLVIISSIRHYGEISWTSGTLWFSETKRMWAETGLNKDRISDRISMFNRGTSQAKKTKSQEVEAGLCHEGRVVVTSSSGADHANEQNSKRRVRQCSKI